MLPSGLVIVNLTCIGIIIFVASLNTSDICTFQCCQVLHPTALQCCLHSNDSYCFPDSVLPCAADSICELFTHIVIVFADHRRTIQLALVSGRVCQNNFCLLVCLVKSDFLGNRSPKPTLSITVLEFTNPFQQNGKRSCLICSLKEKLQRTFSPYQT